MLPALSRTHNTRTQTLKRRVTANSFAEGVPFEQQFYMHTRAHQKTRRRRKGKK
jgi:hypothetical protein